jgi:hypothetical protein
MVESWYQRYIFLERIIAMDRATNYRQALMDEVKDLPEEALPNLVQIVRLFKESLLLQSRQAAQALQEEFAQWDQLSDEALAEFEKDL